MCPLQIQSLSMLFELRSTLSATEGRIGTIDDCRDGPRNTILPNIDLYEICNIVRMAGFKYEMPRTKFHGLGGYDG